MYQQGAQRVEELVREQNIWRGETINLIASENVLSNRARRLLGSDFAHRYAEGHPGARYYEGTEKIDLIEAQVEADIKAIFGAQRADVRPISGTVANEAIFSRFIKPGDVVMVNSTPGGGHISHHAAGSVGKFTRNIVEFPRTPDGYHLDAAKTVELIDAFKPKLLVLGKSLILFPEPVAQLAEVCRQKKIRLIYDGAHVLGLIAGKQFQDPLAEGAELLTGSTHKTFFGSQRGVIISNMADDDWKLVDRGTFPGSTSNHHLDTLAALAYAVNEVAQFGKEYAAQVVANAKALAEALAGQGFAVAAKEFGFTESHQVAVDLEKFGGGAAASRTLVQSGIVVNMNLLPHEPLKNVRKPAGIRIGVQEMTRFGMKQAEMKTIAEFFKKVLVDGRNTTEEVKAFRQSYARVQYSFDDPTEQPII